MAGRIFAITTYETRRKAEWVAEEWKRLGICAIGWSAVNFCTCKSKEEIRRLLINEGYTRGVEDVWSFVGEMSEGDLVLAYSRHNTIAYVGVVKGPCKFVTDNSVGDPDGEFGCPHQREVEWWDEPHHFDRYDLPRYFAEQFGRHGKTVVEINPGSKGFKGFIRIIKTCADSGSRVPGINEDMVKSGLIKYLHSTLNKLEKGLKILNAEAVIGKTKKPRPDFIAEDKAGRTVIIECKGIAGESAVEQIQRYQREYGKGKDCRLMIVAFRFKERCKEKAKKLGNIELVECDLTFNKIENI